MTSTSLAVVLAAVFAASAPCAAQPMEANPEHHGMMGMGPDQHEMSAAQWKDRLGLTTEQEQKLDAAMKDRRDAVQPAMERHRAAMQKLNEQLKSKAPDQDIKVTLDELDKTRGTMESSMDKFWKDVSSILTPTQRAEMMSEMSARMRETRGKGPGHKGMRGERKEEMKEEMKGEKK